MKMRKRETGKFYSSVRKLVVVCGLLFTNILLHAQAQDTMSSPLSIENAGDDVSDTGRASAYLSHDFHIKEGGVAIQNPQWRLVLPLADGTSQTIVLPDNNHSCTVEPVSDESRYEITDEGEIEGALFFSYMSDGVKRETKPFKIYFELKPFIESVVIEKIVDNAPYASYDAHYKIVYHGADKVYVSVEEEYSSILKSSILREPNIAYGVAGHITAPYYAWIDFEVKNDYGKDTYTVELQPYGIVSSFPTKDHGTTAIPSTSANHDIYEAYRMDGVKLGTFTNLSEINRMNYKGVLIVKHKRNGVQTEPTIKLMKR